MCVPLQIGMMWFVAPVGEAREITLAITWSRMDLSWWCLGSFFRESSFARRCRLSRVDQLPRWKCIVFSLLVPTVDSKAASYTALVNSFCASWSRC
mgnify:CR=1 FL=1